MRGAPSIPDPEPIRDALEPIALPSPEFSLALAVLLGLAALILLVVAIRWIRSPRRVAYGSPTGRAQMRLSMIRPDEMPSRDLFRELRAILADYLTSRAGVAALKQTSPEILASLRAAGFADLPELREFLEESDRARFSASGIATATARGAVDQCRAIIERVEVLMKEGPASAAV